MKIVFFTILFFIISIYTIHGQNGGNLIITGFHGTEPSHPSVQQIKSWITQQKVGGVILYQRNIVTKSQLLKLIRYLSHPRPIFIAIDHEGGLVNRFTHPSFDIQLPSPKEFHQLPIYQQKYLAAHNARALHALGFNLNFGGVVDIRPRIQSSSICDMDRCFSSDANSIVSSVSIQNDAYKDHGIIYAIKHFPGHGPTPIDSHTSLPNITKSSSPYDYMPYHQLAPHVDMVMMGHLMNQTVDPMHPSSTSKAHIDDLRTMIGFNGIIITDDLKMGALTRQYPDIGIRSHQALTAGNNLLLYESLTDEELRQIMVQLSQSIASSQTLRNHVRASIDLVSRYLLTSR